MAGALACPVQAAAAPAVSHPEPAPTAATAPPAAIPPLVSPRRESYRGLLATAYVVAPFAAVGLGHAISSSGASDLTAGVGVGAMFFLPAAIHIAHGKTGYGLLSYLEAAGLTAIGVLIGATIGGLITYAACDPEQDSDSCDFAAFPGAPIGAVIGGVLVYSGFAVYDVMANGSVLSGSAAPDHATLQLWMAPAPAAFADTADTTPIAEPGALWGGLQLGVAGQW